MRPKPTGPTSLPEIVTEVVVEDMLNNMSIDKYEQNLLGDVDKLLLDDSVFISIDSLFITRELSPFILVPVFLKLHFHHNDLGSVARPSAGLTPR